MLEDGHIELLLELPNVDLLELAKAPGVVVVESGLSEVPRRSDRAIYKRRCGARGRINMAWNQPDPPKSPWGRRPDPAGADLDARIKEWQRRLGELLRGGPQSGPVRKGIVLFVIGGLVLGWLATGVYQLAAAERGVILRFGAYQQIVREGGAGWHLPWPIETLSKVNVMSVKSQEFRPQVLTSDVNLVDLHFSVQYRSLTP